MTPCTWTATDEVLDELALALHMEEGHDNTAWFDALDGYTLILAVDPECELPELTPSTPEWLREQCELAKGVRDHPFRYRRVESAYTPGRLREFIATVEDVALRDVLEQARREGRGAYRRVGDALEQRGLEQLWYDFEINADRRLALAWLEDQGLIPTRGA